MAGAAASFSKAPCNAGVVVVDAIVVAAQHGQVVHVGVAAVLPRRDVVRFAVLGGRPDLGHGWVSNVTLDTATWWFSLSG